MENPHQLFLLLYVFNIVTIVISNENFAIHETSDTLESDQVFAPKSKRLTLRSIDPLTRRSAAERNFIRFGRKDLNFDTPEKYFRQRSANVKNVATNKKVMNKREAYGFVNDQFAAEPVRGVAVSESELLSRMNGEDERRRRNTRQRRFECVAPTDVSENRDYLLCASPFDNSTDRFFVVAQPDTDEDSEDGGDGSPKQVATPNNDRDYATVDGTAEKRFSSDDNFERVTRDGDGNGAGVKFARNIFSRYDRGRDNFMRLGRSSNARTVADTTKRRHDNFMRLGRAGNDNFMRLGRNKNNNFLRLGRGHDATRLGRDENFRRSLRKYDNFIRLGRFLAGGDTPPHRFARKYDNFMRLGRRDFRLGPNFEPNDYRTDTDRVRYDDNDGDSPEKRARSQNFLRLGRRFESVKYRTNKPDNDGYGDETPEKRGRSENFMRLGRKTTSTAEKKHKNFIRLGKSDGDSRTRRDNFERLSSPKLDLNDVEQQPTNWVDEDNQTKFKRKYGNFMRLGRSTNVCNFMSMNSDIILEYLNDVKSQERLSPKNYDDLSCIQEYYESLVNATSAAAGSQFADARTLENLRDIRNSLEEIDTKWGDEFARVPRTRGLLLRFGKRLKTNEYKNEAAGIINNVNKDSNDDTKVKLFEKFPFKSESEKYRYNYGNVA